MSSHGRFITKNEAFEVKIAPKIDFAPRVGSFSASRGGIFKRPDRSNQVFRRFLIKISKYHTTFLRYHTSPKLINFRPNTGMIPVKTPHCLPEAELQLARAPIGRRVARGPTWRTPRLATLPATTTSTRLLFTMPANR